jgi:hypothetical protein
MKEAIKVAVLPVGGTFDDDSGPILVKLLEDMGFTIELASKEFVETDLAMTQSLEHQDEGDMLDVLDAGMAAPFTLRVTWYHADPEIQVRHSLLNLYPNGRH